MRGTRYRLSGIAVAVWTVSVVAGTAARPANAQTLFEVDGSLSLRYSETTPATAGESGLTTAVSPAITLQVGAPRLVFRVGYLFAGAFNVYGGGSNTYFNLLTFALAAEPSGSSMLTVAASVSQGGAAFQLSERPADAGRPAIRPQDNPDQLWATLSESFRWEVSRSLRMTQSFSAALVALSYSLDQSNAQASISIGLDHVAPRDAIGGVFSSSVALLRPLGGLGDPYYALANSLRATWSHDQNSIWNTEVWAGISHVTRLTQGQPDTFLPTGGITAGFLLSDVGRSGGSIGVAYGPTFDLQTGALTRAGTITARGHVNFDSAATRQLAFSAGYLRSWAVSEAAVLSLAGVGQAVQGDVGFVWSLSTAFQATVRASVAYQFGRPAELAPSLVYTFLLGITGRYSNAMHMPDVPTIGNRVDGADGAGFPAAHSSWQ